MARLITYAEIAKLWKEEFDKTAGISKYSHIVLIPNNGMNVEIEGIEIIPATEKMFIVSTWLFACYLLVRGLTYIVFERSIYTNFINFLKY